MNHEDERDGFCDRCNQWWPGLVARADRWLCEPCDIEMDSNTCQACGGHSEGHRLCSDCEEACSHAGP